MAPWIPLWKYLGFALYLALYFILCQDIWHYPPETFKSVIFKLLPMVQLIFVILSTKSDHQESIYYVYKNKIMYGLLLSMVGDALLVWRVSLFIPGLLFFALAHISYISAFGMTPFGGGPTLMSCVTPALTAYAVLYPGITEGPVMVGLAFLYCTLLFTMMWRSVVCAQTWTGIGSICACLGAIIFAVSDFLIAYDKWRSPIDGAAFYIHITYYLAQLMITTSVACYETRHPLKQD